MPVCVKKERIGPASADQNFSTASQGGYHVHGTLHVLKPAHLTLSNLFASAKTYLQNRFHHATDNMWPKFHMMSTLVIRVLIHKYVVVGTWIHSTFSFGCNSARI